MKVFIDPGMVVIVAPMTDVAQSTGDPSAKTPLGQGTVIPAGWKPTVQKPVPVVQCVAIKRDGVRCGRWSLRGHVKCIKHIGKAQQNFPTVQARIDAVIESARMRLIDSTDLAVDGLIEMMSDRNTADQVRLKAMTEVLDRAGIRGGYEVTVEVEEKVDPAETLAKRLTVLKDRAEKAAEAKRYISGADVEDIVDADVIEDDSDPQRETLF